MKKFIYEFHPYKPDFSKPANADIAEWLTRMAAEGLEYVEGLDRPRQVCLFKRVRAK